EHDAAAGFRRTRTARARRAGRAAPATRAADAPAACHAGRRGGVASRLVLAGLVHVAVVDTSGVACPRRADRVRRLASAPSRDPTASGGGGGRDHARDLGGADSTAAALSGGGHGADGGGLRRVRRGAQLRATRKGRATTMRIATLTVIAVLAV